MKIAYYTAIIGDYEKIPTPEFKDPEIDYHLFTDKPIVSDVWKVHYVQPTGYTDRKSARLFKTHPFNYLPDYDLVIWVDANFAQKKSIIPIVNAMTEDYMLMKHPKRDCIYEEAGVCIVGNLDYDEVISAQTKNYQYQKYPENAGLVATGIILRRNTEKVKKHDARWWEEIKSKSGRDQLSFNYVAWKTKLKYQLFSFDEIGNFFKNNGHKHPRKRYGSDN